MTQRLNRRIVQGTTLIVAALLLCWVVFRPPASDERVEGAIVAEIQEAARGDSVFSLAATLVAPWERVYLFRPYTDPETIRGALGFSWDSPGVRRIGSYDGHVLVVFVVDRRVVTSGLIPRSKGDFTFAIEGEFGSYTRGQATFRTEISRGGRLLIRPA